MALCSGVKKLEQWARSRGIELRFAAPYHPEANGLAERLILDLKQYLFIYPNFVGGWKCALEAAVAHHNRSHTIALGCSPNYAAFGLAPYLPADVQLGIKDDLVLTEEKKTYKQQEIFRKIMKKNVDKRFRTVPDIQVGDFVIVRKGIHGTHTKFSGPYQVTKTATT